MAVNKRGLLQALITVFAILLIDQILKFWVKTSFSMGETRYVFGTWFQLHFVENNGMAFGMELAGATGKILLTLFRVIASIGIGYYLYTLIRKKASGFLIIVISLVLAGAMGNIIDSMFYGIIFSESRWDQVAEFFPAAGGYETFMFGRVVDMFYFPLFTINFPEWMPFVGGSQFTFFEPVFNIADASITIGVLIMLFFQKMLFKKPVQPDDEQFRKENSAETGD